MSKIIQKSEFAIGNARIQVILQGGFSEHGVQRSTSMHLHPNYEVHYINSGTFRFRYLETECEVEKDTLIIIPPKQYHAFESQSADLKRVSFELKLDEQKNGSDMFSQYSHLFSTLDQPLIIKGYIPEFYALGDCMGIIEGDEEICKTNAIFTIVFIKICDILRNKTQNRLSKTTTSATAEANDGELTMIRIISYISNNCKRPLKLDEVAKAVNLSQRQLQRILSARMGEGFNSILSKSRINAAREILANTDNSQSLEEIAYECGFSNYVSFWMQFKRITLRTPESYRHEMRKLKQ